MQALSYELWRENKRHIVRKIDMEPQASVITFRKLDTVFHKLNCTARLNVIFDFMLKKL